MTLQTFNFPNHGNPAFLPRENSPSIELSGGFKFAAEPSEPIIRVFTLSFPTMFYYANPDGTPNTAGDIDPENNVMALWNFYTTHGTWKTFNYPHPAFGTVKVKFDAPFTFPKVSGNRGAVKDLEVTLREHP